MNGQRASGTTASSFDRIDVWTGPTVMPDFEDEVARLDLDHHPKLELVALLDLVLLRDELVAVLPSIQISFIRTVTNTRENRGNGVLPC